jgi:hypothetical protein
MGKQEKYFNYIIGDLVKNTQVDVGRNWFSAPFEPLERGSTLRNFRHLLNLHKGYFYDHVKNKYGVRDEEMETIRLKYVEFIVDKYELWRG